MSFPTPSQLAAVTLTYSPPSPTQRLRHTRASTLLTALAADLVAETGAERPSFPAISTAIETFVGRMFDIAAPDVDFPVLVGDRPYPEGTEVVRVLSRVRMCATRAAGAASPCGDRADWAREMYSALRALELAVATAITATP